MEIKNNRQPLKNTYIALVYMCEDSSMNCCFVDDGAKGQLVPVG